MPRPASTDTYSDREALELVAELIETDPETVAHRLRVVASRSPALAGRVAELLEIDSAHATESGVGAGGSFGQSGEASVAPIPGRVGKYRVLERLGSGAGGVVYRAVDPDLDRELALKVLRSTMTGEEEFVRFKREADILSRLDHPNIATVHEYGLDSDGSVFIAMSLVDATTLGGYLAGSAGDFEERLALLVQICRAVEHAHARGVIHRDLKPSNIMITRTDRGLQALVIDFGIAAFAVRANDDISVTLSGAVIGTPSYMSPEQLGVIDSPVDTRSDIYTLGLILYELLTGESAFGQRRTSSGPVQAIAARIARPSPVLPGKRVAESLGLSSFTLREIDWVFQRATMEEPDRRYHSAGALADDLQRILDGEAVLAAPASRLYRLRKLVARNKAASVFLALLTIALVSATAISTAFGLEATRQEQRTRDALDALTAELAVSSYQRAFDAFEFGDYVSAGVALSSIDHPPSAWLKELFLGVVNSEHDVRPSFDKPIVLEYSEDGRTVVVGNTAGELLVFRDGRRSDVFDSGSNELLRQIVWDPGSDSKFAAVRFDGSRTRHEIFQDGEPGAIGLRTIDADAVGDPGDPELVSSVRENILSWHEANGSDPSGLEIESVRLSRDGSVALVSATTVKNLSDFLFDCRDGGVRPLPTSDIFGGGRVALSSDGAYACCVFGSGLVRIWMADSLELVREFRVPLVTFYACAIRGGEKPELALVFADSTLRRWRFLEPTSFERWSLGVRAVGIDSDPDGIRALSRWEVAPQRGVRAMRIDAESRATFGLSDSRGSWVVLENSGTVRVMEPTGRVRTRFETGISAVRSVELLESESLIVIGTFAGTFAAFDYVTGEQRFRLECGIMINAFAVDPIRKKFVVAHGSVIQIVDTRGQLIAEFDAEQRATALRFSESGERFYLGTDPGSIEVWSIDEGRVESLLRPHTSTVVGIEEVDGGAGIVTIARDEKPAFTTIHEDSITVRLPAMTDQPISAMRLVGSDTLLFWNDPGEVVRLTTRSLD